MKITIIEDDLMIRKELAKLLTTNGYETDLVASFSDVVAKISSITTDLILMDVNLPFQNGYELCKQIKQVKNVPIIFVTCRNTEQDELLSIQAGGIDFVTKPYNKLVLLEKINRALTLCKDKNTREIIKKDYTLDLHLSILKYNHQEIELTRNEFRLLYYFFTNDDRIITKEELIEYLWNNQYYLDESILVVNINRLRKKAQQIGITNFIETVWKKGYRL